VKRLFFTADYQALPLSPLIGPLGDSRRSFSRQDAQAMASPPASNGLVGRSLVVALLVVARLPRQGALAAAFTPRRNHPPPPTSPDFFHNREAASCFFPATRRWCRRSALLANLDPSRPPLAKSSELQQLSRPAFAPIRRLGRSVLRLSQRLSSKEHVAQTVHAEVRGCSNESYSPLPKRCHGLNYSCRSRPPAPVGIGITRSDRSCLQASPSG
jgi:hypothetical protein